MQKPTVTNTQIGIGGNREYKDTLFRKIFGENKEYLLSLYNALNDSDYTNLEDLKIITMEDVLFISMKNDIAFILEDEMNLYEHQSTVNPNMPVRGLMYTAKLIQIWLTEHKSDIYHKKLVKIPTPRYVVFYNGTEILEEKMMLRLSDAFIHPLKEGYYEWTATVYNVNTSHNEELMKRCKALREYADFVRMVKEYYVMTKDATEAIKKALDEAIEKDYLDGYFQREKESVFMTTLYEVDWDIHENNIREDAREEGREEATNILIALIDSLLCDERLEDIKRITKDKDYKNQLLVEYKLLK